MGARIFSAGSSVYSSWLRGLCTSSISNERRAGKRAVEYARYHNRRGVPEKLVALARTGIGHCGILLSSAPAKPGSVGEVDGAVAESPFSRHAQGIIRRAQPRPDGNPEAP